MHISITGLKPKNFFATFRFWFLAIPSFNQAKNAEIPSWDVAFEKLIAEGKNH